MATERGGRGRSVPKPAFDRLAVVVVVASSERVRRTLPMLSTVRLAVDGQQLGLEPFQKTGRRELGLPVRARLAQYAPRVYDDQQVALGSAHRPVVTAVVRHGHAGSGSGDDLGTGAAWAGHFFLRHFVDMPTRIAVVRR